MANFGQHVQYIKKTVQNRLKQLQFLVSWDHFPTTFTSILTYGAEIWHSQLARSNKDILEVLHRKQIKNKLASLHLAQTLSVNVSPKAVRQVLLQPSGVLVSPKAVTPFVFLVTFLSTFKRIKVTLVSW
jgi:hypothetical protein